MKKKIILTLAIVLICSCTKTSNVKVVTPSSIEIPPVKLDMDITMSTERFKPVSEFCFGTDCYGVKRAVGIHMFELIPDGRFTIKTINKTIKRKKGQRSEVTDRVQTDYVEIKNAIITCTLDTEDQNLIIKFDQRIREVIYIDKRLRDALITDFNHLFFGTFPEYLSSGDIINANTQFHDFNEIQNISLKSYVHGITEYGGKKMVLTEEEGSMILKGTKVTVHGYSLYDPSNFFLGKGASRVITPKGDETYNISERKIIK